MRPDRRGKRQGAVDAVAYAVETLNAVPEDDPFAGAVRSIGVLEVPGVDGVVRAGTPEQLRDEIRAATEYRDNFLKHVDTLIERYTGRYFRSDRALDRAITANHAYEFMSVMLPSLVYDAPQFKGLAYANVCKNRHGPVGHVELSWRGEFLKFGDLAKQEMQIRDRWSVAS